MKRLHRIVLGASSAVLALSACGGASSTAKVASVADVKGATATSTAQAVAAMSEQTIVVGGGSSQDGPGGANGDGSNSEAFRTQLLVYAKCMRDNGVDFPDPQFDANGRPQMNGDRTQFDAQRNDPKFQKAETACADKRPGRAGGFKMSAEQQAKTKETLLNFAKCMRGKGIDFPDPTFGSDGRPQFGANGPQGDMNRDDPTFQTAEASCRTEVGFNFGPGGREGGLDDHGGSTTTNVAKS
ncbi:MAG: hypothetical protein RIQ64_1571 [Actinomycetota bacterium]|jgi:hypothetical protein